MVCAWKRVHLCCDPIASHHRAASGRIRITKRILADSHALLLDTLVIRDIHINGRNPAGCHPEEQNESVGWSISSNDIMLDICTMGCVRPDVRRNERCVVREDCGRC